MKRRMRSGTRAVCLTVGIAVLLAGAQAAEAGLSDLNTLNSLTTGDYSFTADGQTFDARVENIGGTGWLLVGRGRQGWEFDNDGQGAVAAVNQGLGTPAAFAPALYSDAIINDLVSNSGINLTGAEIRIRRAGDSAGVDPYQEARWRPITQTTWRANFDDPQFNVEYEIVSGFSSPLAPINTNTRDGGPNNFQRIFTWAWGGHANQQGFSYGNVTADGANNATSFWWENGTENHAIPYTEVYIRSEAGGGPSRFEVGGNNTIGTETLTGTQTNEVYGGVDDAKYVRVVQNVTNTFQVAELQAFETGTGTNKAKQSEGGSATAKDSGYGTNPGRANDDNLAQNYPNLWHSTSGQGTWLEIELAAATDLDYVHFWGRSDCCHDRQDNFNLIVEDAARNVLHNEQIVGLGSSPGQNGPIPLGPAGSFSADLLATLQSHDAGDGGFTYVFEIGSADMITVDNPDPSIFTTILDLNDAAIEIEVLTALEPGYHEFQLLDADVLQGSLYQIILPDVPDHAFDTSRLETDGILGVHVPEPATLALLSVAACGLGGYVRKRKRA